MMTSIVKRYADGLVLSVLFGSLTFAAYFTLRGTTQNECRLRDQKITSTENNTMNLLGNNTLQPSVPNNPVWTPFYERIGRNSKRDLPRILFWTQIYGSWYSDLTSEGVAELEYKGCPNKCYIANDRRTLRKSDAIVFYGRDLNLDDMPPVRSQGQKWVYWSLEPPWHCASNSLRYLNDTFNWTMTYRYDSDILDAYGAVHEKATDAAYSWSDLKKIWKGKTRMAAWAVSRCDTFGKREDYVEDLRRYIAVDVYGACGNYSCLRSSKRNCHAMFEKQYFFYLSFENAICKDYVTEKFYRILKHNLIPVVFGGAKYSDIAPAGSYIDALSFSSPKELAKYLKIVSSDFSLYKRYFAWKKKYSIHCWGYYTFCGLCEKLHSESFKKRTVYESIHKWWNTSSHCKAWNKQTNAVYE